MQTSCVDLGQTLRDAADDMNNKYTIQNRILLRECYHNYITLWKSVVTIARFISKL